MFPSHAYAHCMCIVLLMSRFRGCEKMKIVSSRCWVEKLVNRVEEVQLRQCQKELIIKFNLSIDTRMGCHELMC